MWHRFPVGLRAWLGIELNPVSHTERVVSAVGGFLGIFLILIMSGTVLGDRDATLLIVTSMGASAVLLFAVPHGPLSQPWSLIGGHSVSAFIGVSCALLVPQQFLAAALAVGLSIGAMHALRCVHPPGGAIRQHGRTKRILTSKPKGKTWPREACHTAISSTPCGK